MDFKKARGGVYARNFLYAGSIGILMLSLLLGCSPMAGTWPPLKVDAASGGYSHTMVLKSDGSLWATGDKPLATGDNRHGQLSTGAQLIETAL